MAGPIDSGDNDVIASINMIPFIDIALVLLIIFLVTSSYIVSHSIQVNLPAAASGGEATASTVGIAVESDGSLRLNGTPVQRDALLQALRNEVANDPATQAIIAGDRGAEYGIVVDVLDLVIQAGMRSYQLNIERRPAEGTSTPR
ncbi:MAG: biopolymer transporter ExbD [Deltaproteobacteria bacterium]|nr:MAG: biopolymer transporter ExbD [Deltaproteobacteria bacterium]